MSLGGGDNAEFIPNRVLYIPGDGRIENSKSEPSTVQLFVVSGSEIRMRSIALPSPFIHLSMWKVRPTTEKQT